MFNGIYDAIHRELRSLDEKYSNGTQLSGKDLEDIDKMAHTLKSLSAYEAMAGNSGYEGDSYARGRSRTTGRYVSRDGGYSGYNSQDSDSYGRRY